MGRGKRNAVRRGPPLGPLGNDVLLSQSDHRAIAVTPGLLDDRARAAFQRGQCHALALALHDAFGYELAVYEDDDADAVHVFVTTKDGRALDAGGTLSLEEHQEIWGGTYFERYSRERVAHLHEDGCWREPDLEIARSFVKPVQASLSSASDYIYADELDVETVAEPEMRVVGRSADYHLRPGVLDDEARACFRDGQAHALAMALCIASSRAGAEMLVLDDGEDEPSRAFLGLKDGRLLDVDGVHRREEIERLGSLSKVRYRDLREAEDWPSADVAAAQPFAAQLLALFEQPGP